MSKAKTTVTGTLIYKQFIQLADGTELQVRYNQSKELYNDTDVQVYEYLAHEGSGTDRVEVIRYAVAVDDVLTTPRNTVDSMQAMIAQGLSADDIQAKMIASYTAKITAKLAKF